MEKILITGFIVLLALLVVITLLFSKKSNKSYKATQKNQTPIESSGAETEPNPEQQKTPIEKKEPVAMIQQEKPKIERYCYKVDGKFYWKARKPKEPTKKAPNYDLFDPKNFLK